MKTLYLHIGTPKTATTAIQSFCIENQEILNQKGYYYPQYPYEYPNVKNSRNAHFLIAFKHNKDKNRNYEESEQVWEEGFTKIYDWFENHDHVILSDEAIWNFGYRDQSRVWRRLKEESEKGGFVIKVIVYIRRQDEYLFSWWNQQIKEGMHPNSVLTWDKMVETKSYIQLDYEKMIENIAAFIQKENITVRLFDRNQFYGGSIYADFMNCIGLEYTDEYRVEVEMKNISLTKNNNELKRIINALPGLDDKTNRLFRKYLSELSKLNPEEKKTDMFSQEECDRFMEEYQAGNEKIAKEFLHTDVLFDEKKSNEKWDPKEEQIYEDIVSLFGMMTLHLMNENAQLKKELKMQKQSLEKLKSQLKHPFRTIKKKIVQ